MSNITDQSQFNNVYWAAQAPLVSSLKGGNADTNQIKLPSLIAAGYLIDVPIMIWGLDPYYTMYMRKQYGYTWVPSATQPPISVAPGLAYPGAPEYDPAHPPAGSIKVSLDPIDYPPFVAPPPPPPLPTGLVGAYLGYANMYVAVQGQNTPLKDGQIYEQDGVMYTYHKVGNPFGFAVWFTKN